MKAKECAEKLFELAKEPKDHKDFEDLLENILSSLSLKLMNLLKFAEQNQMRP